MLIYLPIAEMPVDMLLIIGLGGAVGFLSGMFGIGGGFILTPFLMFFGIPPAVAVATQSVQLVATSFSSALSHWRAERIDFKMGLYVLIGGLAGSVLGIAIFNELKARGQVELLISLTYVVLLTAVGGLMLAESLSAWRRGDASEARPSPGTRSWLHRLPLKVRFNRSKLYISAIPPVVLGGLIGVLSSIMGVGGGFILVPAMIYLLRMPTAIVVGTSVFQVIFISAFSTFLHAVTNHSVDAILAALLTVGGVLGAQFGVRLGARLRAERLRLILALMILAIGVRLTVDLILPPNDRYSIIDESVR
jgi:uncharacterized membrane protein YfcA